MDRRLEGLIAAPFTPMTSDGKVDVDRIGDLAEFLHRNGVKGAFVAGTTGESMSLTLDERLDVARRWVEAAPKDFSVLIHVGHTSIEVCKILAAQAQEIGAWGIGAMGPCFFRPRTLDDLIGFCAEIAAAAPALPFYYYHIPELTRVDFPMAEFLEAAPTRIPNLMGIKYTAADLVDFQLCRGVDGGRFNLLFGCDEILICGLALGARGAVGSTYNFAAPLYNKIIEAFDAGNVELARFLQQRSVKMVRALNRAGCSLCAAAKSVMKMVGLDCGPTRMPLRAITREQAEALQLELREIGFFETCSR